MLDSNHTHWDKITILRLHKSFTICFTVFYSLIFITAYIQLWLVLYLRHKLVSTQTIYFLLSCIFTSQRVVLFSFFFKTDAEDNDFRPLLSWFLVTFPVVIHYTIVLLITIFYLKTYIKTKGLSSAFSRCQIIYISIPVVIIFLLNLFPLWFDDKTTTGLYITSARLLLTDSIFIGTIIYFVFIYQKFPEFPNAMLVVEAKRITKARSIVVGSVCILASCLKFSYDIVAIVLKSDSQSDFKLPLEIEKEDFIEANRKFTEFILFGTVLFIWELIPLIAAMILFRVQFPSGTFNLRKVCSHKEMIANLQSNSIVTNSSSTTKSKFTGIQRYGAFNNCYSSTEGSSGPITPGLFGSPSLFPYTIQRADAHSFDTETTARNMFVSNIYIESNSRENILNPRTPINKQQFNRLMKPPNRSIYRSSSNKNLMKNRMIAEYDDPKTSTAHLSAAKE